MFTTNKTLAYFTSATRPTRGLLTWLLIGMLVLEGMPSIERMLNLVNVAHSAMKILPHQYACWKYFQKKSPQELQFAISKQISRKVFLTALRTKDETIEKFLRFFDMLTQLVKELWSAA